MNNQKSAQVLQEEIDERIWDGKYFGSTGAVALAYKFFLKSNWNNTDELSAVTLMYTSTLYSAFTHCVAQLKHFHLIYVFRGVKVFVMLIRMVSFIFRKKLYKNLDASQKEVLMAVLMVCDSVVPFAGYHKHAKRIGIEILSDSDCSLSTSLLVKARFSRLRSYDENKKLSYKQSVWAYIRIPSMQKEIGWKTISRLARLIDDDEMVEYSAPLSDSADVMIKSGI